MLWKTHIRISREVLRRLGIYLAPEVFQSFTNGIVAPDKWQDFPHHYGKSEKIKENLITSRGYFLRDDLRNAFFYLGVALHYIQDSYTSLASSYVNHHRWEESIEYCNFTDDLKQTIKYTLRNNDWERNRCLGLADALSKKAHGRDNTLYLATLTGQVKSESFAEPTVDLNLGLRASYVVMESVLSSKNCPALENELREGLSNYEALLRTAELDLSNKIVGLVNERIELEKQKVPPLGIVSKIRNWILRIKIGLKERTINSNNNYYIKQGHLDKVVKEYIDATNRTVAPYAGWYNFLIPRINPNLVSKELLSIQEIAKVLGENKQSLKESLHKFNISSYYVKNRELIRRADLDRFLSQSPVKGFTKYSP
jgi:hypothetical protein